MGTDLNAIPACQRQDATRRFLANLSMMGAAGFSETGWIMALAAA